MPTLKVFVNEATNLFGADLDGKSDPYLVLKIGEGNQFSAIEKTRKISNTKNPQWKETFTLNVNNPLTEFLFLEVWNKESMSKDDSLGTARVSLTDLQRGVEKQVWVQLEGGQHGGNIIGQIASHLGKKKKEEKNQGKVFLGLTALDFGIDPNLAQQQFSQQPGMMQGQSGMQQPGMMHGQSGIQQPGMQSGIQQPGMQQGIQGQSGVHAGQSGLHQQGISGQGFSGQGVQGQQGFSGSGMQGSQIPSTTTPSSSTHPPVVPAQQSHQQQHSAYPQDL
jgi:hypothetical protein